MKKLFVLGLAAVTSLLMAGVASANSVTDTIRVTSMQCGMCESRIEKALKAHSYISDVEADVENEVVVVTYDKSLSSKEGIAKLISLTGYDTETVAADAEAQNSLHGCCKPGAHKKASAPSSAPKKEIKKASSGK